MAQSIDISTTTALITGGTNGIGRALAEHFARAGAKVYVTSRKPQSSPGPESFGKGSITVIQSDIASSSDRESLYNYVKSNLSELNVLINNAGIARVIPLAQEGPETPWTDRQKEVDTLLSGPIHLCSLLVPLMLKNGKPGMVVNVTSIGGFYPVVINPLYSVCKAGMRNFTLGLRWSLKNTSLRVVDIFPGLVKTNLKGTETGQPLEDFMEEVWPQILAGKENISSKDYITSEVVKDTIEVQERALETWGGIFKNVQSYADTVSK